MTDKELDEILKQKLNEPAQGFDEVSWVKMSEKLDAFYAKKQKRKYFIFSAIALLFLATTGVYYNVADLGQGNPNTFMLANKGLNAADEQNKSIGFKPWVSKNQPNNYVSDKKRTQNFKEISELKPHLGEANNRNSTKKAIDDLNEVNLSSNKPDEITTAKPADNPETTKEVSASGSTQRSAYFFNSKDRLAEPPPPGTASTGLFYYRSKQTPALAKAQPIISSIKTELNVSNQPVSLVSINSKLPQIKPVFKTQHSIGALAGLAVCNKFGTQTGFSTGPEDFNLGIYYAFSFKPNLTAEVNLIYASRGAKAGKHHYRQTIYGFGSEQNDITLEPLRLYYLEMPLLLKYQLLGNIAIGAGGYVANLVDGQSRVSEEYKSTTGDYSNNQLVDEGYIFGFEKIDYGLTAAIDYTVLNGVNVELRMVTGLKDVTQNSYFENNIYDRNVSFRLLLKYEIK